MLPHKSFNGALKDIAVEILKGQGHNVVVSDLYAQKFNPVPNKEELGIEGKISNIIRFYFYKKPISTYLHLYFFNKKSIDLKHI